MSHLAIITVSAGIYITLLHALGILATAAARGAVRAFPRHRLAGLALMTIAVLWVAWLIHETHLGFAERYKPLLYVLTPVALYLIGRHMDELLAPRALGGLLLLAPSPMLHAARPHVWNAGPWAYVVPVLAYALVIAGAVLVLSPYRFRRVMEFWDHSALRFRCGGALGVALGLFLIYLGCRVY